MPEQQNPEHQLEYLKELRRKYEEAFSNAQKTGDYTEATKLKDELNERLSALEARFPKPEIKSELVQNKYEKVEKGAVVYEKAQEIMKEDFFGWEAVKKTFKIEVGGTMMIPYSEAQLEQAKNQGEMLVYRVGGLTMEGIVNEVKLHKYEGQLLSNRDTYHHEWDWYKDEDFFKKQKVRQGWALVRKNIIPDSTSQNYIEQTATLRDYLTELDSLSMDELAQCTDDKLAQIKELDDKDWQLAAKVLSDLKINQNHRRTPVEVLYDFVIRFKNTYYKERILEDSYDWTNTRSSIGQLIYFGEAGPEGAIISSSSPGITGAFGLVPVR